MITLRTMSREKIVDVALVVIPFAAALVTVRCLIVYGWHPAAAALGGLWTLSAIVQVYANFWPRDRDLEERIELRRRLRRRDG